MPEEHFALDGNCSVDEQMWPSSHHLVQQSCEGSLDLSHNVTLLWDPRTLSPAGFLSRLEQVEHTAVLQNFPSKTFGNHWTFSPPWQRKLMRKRRKHPQECYGNVIWHLTCSDIAEYKSAEAAATAWPGSSDWCCTAIDRENGKPIFRCFPPKYHCSS